MAEESNKRKSEIAEGMVQFRKRKKANETPEQAESRRQYEAERKQEYRKKKLQDKHNSSTSVPPVLEESLVIESNQENDSAVLNTDVSIDEAMALTRNWERRWIRSILKFKTVFIDNEFGHACSVCDRLWFQQDLKEITATQMKVISDWYTKENRVLLVGEYTKLCAGCKYYMNKTKSKNSMPKMAKVHGFAYPERPVNLPQLDPISERLISPRLPFMQVRRLRFNFSYGIIGQVINVPVDVQEMVKCLPRMLDEDEVINIHIKRNLAHKSSYLRGYVRKKTVKVWLEVLQKSSLYRLYDIKVDLARLNSDADEIDVSEDDKAERIESISAKKQTDSEILASRQQTVMWNEDECLYMAPGQRKTPLNLIYDHHAEELSFPAIYFGEPRRFHMGVSVTPYMMATSEIRRSDRRGSTPQKILYVAMKIMRLRMIEGVYNTFRNVSMIGNITRRMLENPEMLQEFAMKNLAFMRTIPNSVQYWASRKRDLFAMMRQLGKPTIFLTIT